MLLDSRFWLFVLVFILAVILVWIVGLSTVKKGKGWLSSYLYPLLLLWTFILFFFTVACYLIFANTLHSYLVLMLFFANVAFMVLSMLSMFVFRNHMVSILSAVSWIILSCAVLALNVDSGIAGFDITLSILLSFAFILLVYERRPQMPIRLTGN